MTYSLPSMDGPLNTSWKSNDQAEELVHAIASRKGIKCHRKHLVVEEDHQPLTEKLEAIFGRIDTDN